MRNLPSFTQLADVRAALSTKLGKPRALERLSLFDNDAPPLGWAIAVSAILALILLPLLTTFYIALTSSDNIWPHLVRNVLPNVIFDTLALTFGVAFISICIGVGSAWLVTMYRFPGRAVVDYLLVLPLAMPTYIVAYCYVDLLDHAGPVQTWLAEVFGWQNPKQSWFPEVRSLPGAILILASVLYPYVYLTARASFVQQSVCVLEVARTLGQTASGVFWSIGLPLARPAIAAGAVLVVMESLNDLGAVQHLGIDTFSASIYATWMQRSSLAGAAQLSSLLLVFIVIILLLERHLRHGAKSFHTTGRYRAIPVERIEGYKGYLTLFLVSLPFLLGFVIPVSVLVQNASTHLGDALESGFLYAVGDSLLVATAGAIATVLAALTVAYARRLSPHPYFKSSVWLSSLGYAAPGTVLALGLLFSLGGLDAGINSFFEAGFGFSSGQIFSGTILAIVIAYVIRFCAVAMANVDAGLERISPSLDAAARTLGETTFTTFWRVHLRLLMPAIGAAALLVFVDAMKELPATLLLRPFNFETLATHVYNLVSLEQFEQSSLGALAIVLVGIIPVLLLHQAVSGGRAGNSASSNWKKRWQGSASKAGGS